MVRGRPSSIHKTLPGTQWHPSAAALGDGSYVVAWEGFSQKDDYSIYTRRLTSAGRLASSAWVGPPDIVPDCEKTC